MLSCSWRNHRAAKHHLHLVVKQTLLPKETSKRGWQQSNPHNPCKSSCTNVCSDEFRIAVRIIGVVLGLSVLLTQALFNPASQRICPDLCGDKNQPWFSFVRPEIGQLMITWHPFYSKEVFSRSHSSSSCSIRTNRSTCVQIHSVSKRHCGLRCAQLEFFMVTSNGYDCWTLDNPLTIVCRFNICDVQSINIYT